MTLIKDFVSSTKALQLRYINKLLNYEQNLFFLADKIIFHSKMIKNKSRLFLIFVFLMIMSLVWVMLLFNINWTPIFYPVLVLVGLYASRVLAYLVAILSPIFNALICPIIHCSFDKCGLNLFRRLDFHKFTTLEAINLIIAVISYLIVIEICIYIKCFIEDEESDNKFLRNVFVNMMGNKDANSQLNQDRH